MSCGFRTWPLSLPGGSVRLSQFQNYTSLRKLKVAAGDILDHDYSAATEFLLDTALSALQFLSVRHKLICNVTAGHSFAELLPSVQHACVNLQASVDGLILAQSIMVSQTMCKLELYLIKSDGPSTTLQVPKSSQLTQLILNAPVKPRVSLQLCKVGVQLQCSNVHKVSSAHAPATFKHLAVFPKDDTLGRDVQDQ